MASDLNQCNFIGRLGKKPESRSMPNGDNVTNFSIACGESWKDKSGQKQEKTEWVNVVAYRKLGEICAQYLDKGSQVYISGKFRTRKWEKDGVNHYSTEIIAENMQMLGGKSEAAPAKAKAAKPVAEDDDFSDPIPF